MTGQRVAVVGAGTAGLSTAIFLARQGCQVTVFERVAEIKAVGAGILLQPSGMAALSELDALDLCAQHGAPIARLYGTSGERVILNTPYQDWRQGSFGMGIHRSVLLNALSQVAAREAIQIQTGVVIDGFTQDAHSVRLQQAGQDLGAYDALILADGTRSQLRAQMRNAQTVEPYPWGALWAVLPTPEDLPPTTDLRQWYRGCSQMFGLMPTGTTFEAPEQALTSLFWSLPTAQYSRWQDEGLSAWKAQVRALTPEVEGFLDQIQSPAQLTFAQYADVRMKNWHDGRVLAIGDCAHAMSPQLGQGANMALVDALILSRATRESADVRDAFADYSKMRQDHLRYYRQASRLLTPLFQSHSRTLAMLRDIGLATARRTRVGRRQAVETLVGAKTGWWTGELPKSDLYAWSGSGSERLKDAGFDQYCLSTP